MDVLSVCECVSFRFFSLSLQVFLSVCLFLYRCFVVVVVCV